MLVIPYPNLLDKRRSVFLISKIFYCLVIYIQLICMCINRRTYLDCLTDRSCSRPGGEPTKSTQLNRQGGADVAKWIKAMDCGSITRGFNPRRSPIIQLGNSIPSLCLEQRRTVKVDGICVGLLYNNNLEFPI